MVVVLPENESFLTEEGQLSGVFTGWSIIIDIRPSDGQANRTSRAEADRQQRLQSRPFPDSQAHSADTILWQEFVPSITWL
jgi:hypothetical protein